MIPRVSEQVFDNCSCKRSIEQVAQNVVKKVQPAHIHGQREQRDNERTDAMPTSRHEMKRQRQATTNHDVDLRLRGHVSGHM